RHPRSVPRGAPRARVRRPRLSGDARLSALHRGDFGPGGRFSLTGLNIRIGPSALLAPRSYSGRRAGAEPQRRAVAGRRRGTPLLAPSAGSPPETPLMSEDANLYPQTRLVVNNVVICRQYSFCLRHLP